MKISAVIIAKNEEKMIINCLRSLTWVDEIVLIDTGSTDKTVQIAKSYKAKIVLYNNGKNYSDWRNKAKSEALGEWLFYVDSDERVPSSLQKEILEILENPKFAAYAIPRKNNLLGHDMKYGGWWPDYVLRLIRKKDLIKWEGEVHEQPKINGKVGKLNNSLYHITHRTLTEMIQKTNRWSEIEARLMFEANHPPMNIPRFMTAMFREFWYRAIIKLGFLDGPIGIIEILYQVFSRFVSYSKLWELQENQKLNKKTK